jgi:hypothetical protein
MEVRLIFARIAAMSRNCVVMAVQLKIQPPPNWRTKNLDIQCANMNGRNAACRRDFIVKPV